MSLEPTFYVEPAADRVGRFVIREINEYGKFILDDGATSHCLSADQTCQIGRYFPTQIGLAIANYLKKLKPERIPPDKYGDFRGVKVVNYELFQKFHDDAGAVAWADFCNSASHYIRQKDVQTKIYFAADYERWLQLNNKQGD